MREGVLAAPPLRAAMAQTRGQAPSGLGKRPRCPPAGWKFRKRIPQERFGRLKGQGLHPQERERRPQGWCEQLGAAEALCPGGDTGVGACSDSEPSQQTSVFRYVPVRTHRKRGGRGLKSGGAGRESGAAAGKRQARGAASGGRTGGRSPRPRDRPGGEFPNPRSRTPSGTDGRSRPRDAWLLCGPFGTKRTARVCAPARGTFRARVCMSVCCL